MRHGPEEVAAELVALPDGRRTATLARRDQGLAPGQFAVLYRGDVCLGCGVIDDAALPVD